MLITIQDIVLETKPLPEQLADKSECVSVCVCVCVCVCVIQTHPGTRCNVHAWSIRAFMCARGSVRS